MQSDEFEDIRDFQYPSTLSEACLASVQELQVPLQTCDSSPLSKDTTEAKSSVLYRHLVSIGSSESQWTIEANISFAGERRLRSCRGNSTKG
jgi:hypothetical protein